MNFMKINNKKSLNWRSCQWKCGLIECVIELYRFIIERGDVSGNLFCKSKCYLHTINIIINSIEVCVSNKTKSNFDDEKVAMF